MSRRAKLIAICRKLRIPFTVFWATLCIVSLAFWVRSYRHQDSIWVWLPPSEHIQVSSGDARMVVYFDDRPIDSWGKWHAHELTSHTKYGAANRIPHFNLAFWPHFARLYLAHWVPVVTCALLAVLPWIPWRFNVRNLLIATTIAGVVAGLIAWVDRTY